MDKFLRSNMVVKGIAFLVALMLWMIVNLNEQPQPPGGQRLDELRIENVEVEVQYDEERYTLTEMEEQVHVILMGRRAVLLANQLRSDPYRIFADLTNAGPGRHRVLLQYEGFPPEIQVEIIPSHVNVVLEEKKLHAFSVDIELTGDAKEGYRLGKPILSPDQVYVIAPASVRDQISTVKGFVNIDGAIERMTQEVNLKAYDRYGNEVDAEISPQAVHVDIPVKSPSAKVPLRLVHSPPEGVTFSSIELSHQEVEVFAPLNVLNELDEIPIQIDLSNITQSTTQRIEIPTERSWHGVQPAHIEVQIEVGPTLSRTFHNIPIQVQGLEQNLELVFLEPEEGFLQLDVTGSKDLVTPLKPADIQATVDVTGLSAGEHTVEVSVNLPQHLQRSPARIDTTVRLQAQSQETSNELDTEEEGE